MSVSGRRTRYSGGWRRSEWETIAPKPTSVVPHMFLMLNCPHDGVGEPHCRQGTRGNARGRAAALRPCRARDGRRLARRPRRYRRRTGSYPHAGDRGASPIDPHVQQITRHPVRPIGQRLSRVRAWMRLLLRPAHARLSRSLARPGFRNQAVRQAGRRRAAARDAGQTDLRGAPDRDRHQHRSLSADRAAIPDQSAGAGADGGNAPPDLRDHQVRPGARRYRSARRSGTRRADGGGDLGHQRSTARSPASWNRARRIRCGG